jgi:hypothetical protein
VTRRSSVALVTLVFVAYVLVPYRWAEASRSSALSAARNADRERAAIDQRITHARSVDMHPAEWARLSGAAATAFPATVDVSGTLMTLRTIATVAQAQLLSVTASPPPPSNTGAPTPVPTTIKLLGTIGQLQAFLTAVRASPRLLTTSAAALTYQLDGLVSATLSAEIWLMPTSP